MTFTNLEKYVYSKKCLKQRRQPPYPSLQQSRRSGACEGIFAPKKSPGHGCYKRFEWVIFSQPRGDRGATMEEGEVQIFFLIAIIISFLSGNSSCQVNHNNRTLLGPYYRYQLPVTKYSIANLKA